MMTTGVSLSVVILTFNEEVNIAECIASCAFSDDIHVLDSGSTDRTCEIAVRLGAHVHHHRFASFGEQRNWAIDNIDHKHDWVFHLDADERLTPEMAKEISQTLRHHPPHAGFYVPHKLFFMGKWIRHAEGYPVYQMRLFHRKRMRFRDYGHGQREETIGEIGWLHEPYFHYNFSKGISEWVDKHNRYSSREADAIKAGRESGPISIRPRFFGDVVQRRRFLNLKLGPQMPGRWMARFVWGYVVKLGFLDGMAGLHYCLLMSYYDFLISLKLREQKLSTQAAETLASRSTTQVMVPQESGLRNEIEEQPPKGGSLLVTQHAASPASTVTREGSPWSSMEKTQRALWMLTQATLFRWSFHNWYAWRRFLLRLFGAKIGDGVCIRPTARIEIPWHLQIGEGSIVGDFAVLYCLGEVSIGRHAVISQYVNLCAGTHDYTSRRFPLIRRPIAIGDEAWIAADAFISPGVTVGDRSVVGARSTVVKDVPPDQVWVGSPAHFIKPRELRDEG